MVKKRLDNNLHAYRKNAGYTLSHASLLLGSTDRRYFARLERGQREPTGRDIYSCERIFGIPNSNIFPGLRLYSYRRTDRRMSWLHSKLRMKTLRPDKISRRLAQALGSLTERLRPIAGTLGI